MSKFFGWLKKDKQKSESQSDAQDSTNEAPTSVTESPNDGEVSPENIAEEAPFEPSEAVLDSLATNKVKITPAELESSPVVTEQPTELESNPVVTEQPAETITTNVTENALPPAVIADPPAKTSLFSKLRQSLSRTKENLGSGLVSLFRGKAIDDELFEELETQLLVADVGMDTTTKIIKKLTDSAGRKQLKDGDALYQLLKEQMTDILSQVDKPLDTSADDGPFVILMVGVNGVGKTTTIGKMAKQFQQQGKKVMLAAGDTFRAAAVEQLQVWGERNNIPVIAQKTGSDSASVIFDALQSAKARNIDVLIADTAGRLQNKEHLMEELKKVVRVMRKINPDAPHEIMLTLDAGTGQNAVSQTKLFNQAVGLTGITLAKLDGTAKGGVIFAIADRFKIPIRYIGVGEAIDDLRPFNSGEFVDALFAENSANTSNLQ